MKYNLGIEEKLNFDETELISPDIIIGEIGDELEEVTKGFVKGIVGKYEGQIESYDQISSFASIASALGTAVIHKDVQDKLGAIGDNNFTFEFYLVAPKFENYKYRVLFFEYGIGNYPVKLVIEQGIADEIFGDENSDYIIIKDTKLELENTIKNIMSTKKVIKVMQDLIVASQKIIKLEGKRQLEVEENTEL